MLPLTAKQRVYKIVPAGRGTNETKKRKPLEGILVCSSWHVSWGLDRKKTHKAIGGKLSQQHVKSNISYVVSGNKLKW